MHTDYVVIQKAIMTLHTTIVDIQKTPILTHTQIVCNDITHRY